MILRDPTVEIDCAGYGHPRCAILHGGPPTPTESDPSGTALIWTYGRSGDRAIRSLQTFVEMMQRERRRA
jgi:hypothetical protein